MEVSFPSAPTPLVMLGMMRLNTCGRLTSINARALAHWRASRAYGGPVLVLYGTLDPLISREMAEATAAFFPKARLQVLEGVGHSLNLENPGLLKAILEGFLKEVAG